MKFIERKILVLFLLLVGATLYGQAVDSTAVTPQRNPEDIAEYQTFMLKKDLQLTDEQADAVYKVNLKYVQLGRPQSRQQAEERMKQKLSDLKAILTEQQYALFVKKTQEIKRMRGGLKLQPIAVDTVDSIVQMEVIENR